MSSRIAVVFFVISLFSSCCHAQYLQYQISGADGELEDNIKAHLGKPPETKAEALSLLHSLEKKIQRAASALGYDTPSIQQQLQTQTTPWQLQIEIEPGPATQLRQQDIQIKGEAESDPAFDKLLQTSLLPLNKRLKHSQYDSLKTQIQGLGISRGYFQGRYQASSLKINPDNHSAEVQLIYDSGPRFNFGKVAFSNNKLKPELLQQLNPIPANQPYRPALLAELNRSLIQTGYFSSVKITPLIEQAEELKVPIQASLSHPAKHNLQLGIGYSTDTEERISLTWKTPLINSAGHSQETKLVYSKVRPYLKSIYTIPLAHPLDDQLQLRTLIDSDEYGALESDRMTFSVGRQTRIENSWLRHYYLRLLKENWQLNNTHFDGKFILPGISFSRSKRRGPAMDPSHGLTQLIEIEGGDSALGSSESILRAKANLRWLTTFAAKHRLIARTELGATWLREHELDDIPPSMRFFTGGDQSIRGFAYQSLGPTRNTTNAAGQSQRRVVGGRYLLVGSLEYQYEFIDNWRLPLFVDAGNAFESTDFDPVYSMGSGLHWVSPIGPIQLEFAFGISEDNVPFRLHFSIGAEL